MPKIGNAYLKQNRTRPTNVPVIVRNSDSNRSLERAVAAAVRRSEGKFGNDASDTDSMASSVSSFSGVNGRKPGVSPLNRRKSLRLATKKNSEMQVTASLRSQNTVRMGTPEASSLQRMETTSRWMHHRSNRLKSQETLIIPENSHKPVKLTKGVSKWINYRKPESAGDSEPSSMDSKWPRLLTHRSRSTLGGSSVSLLRKKSTTWGIRAMLGATGLNHGDDQGAGTNVDQAGFDEPDSGKTVSDRRRKRKVTEPLPSITEETDKKPRVKKGVTFASAASCAAPSTSSGKTSLKRRQSSSLGLFPVSEDEGFLHKTKRMCIDRSESNRGPVFVANKRDWPISMEAQVVWKLNLTDTMDENVEPKCALVNTERCLVGSNSGNVFELDASVSPSRRLELPSGVSCFTSTGKSVYAGCMDGSIYDISDENTKLLWRSNGFQEIKQMSCHSDMLAVIDCVGKVAVFNTKSGATVWTEEKFLCKAGVSIHMDETGVYISHADRLTKYSLDGRFVWGISGDNFASTVLAADELYTCSGGDVHKIDKYSNGKTLFTYKKGQVELGYANLCTVGAGLVFVAGKTLICYDEKSGDVVYSVNLPSSEDLISIQFFQMRLFCLFSHSLQVLDFTEQSIVTGKEGHQIECALVSLPQSPDRQLSSCSQASTASSLSSINTEDSADLDTKPKARRGKLKVKATSIKKTARS